jgi:nucleotide-binding universal stress UspA family protein
MLPLKKIICPTDFSDPSYEGVKAANELAVHFSAELILVNVVSPVPPIAIPSVAQGFDVGQYQKELISSSKRSLSDVVKDMISGDLQFREVIVEGPPADQIIALAESEKADAIVIATHGLTGWRRFIFGSVAEKVVRLASCPVITIPAPHEDQ